MSIRIPQTQKHQVLGRLRCGGSKGVCWKYAYPRCFGGIYFFFKLFETIYDSFPYIFTHTDQGETEEVQDKTPIEEVVANEVENYTFMALKVARETNLNYYQVQAMSVFEVFYIISIVGQREEKELKKLKTKET